GRRKQSLRFVAAAATAVQPAPANAPVADHDRTHRYGRQAPSSWWTRKPSCVDLSGETGVGPGPAGPGDRIADNRVSAESKSTAMLQGWFVIVVALVYIGLLFVIASYGDRLGRLGGTDRPRP